MEDVDICPECNGTGKAEPNCDACNGYGWVDDPTDDGTMTCPFCDNEPCDNCGGSGEIEIIEEE